MDTVGTFEMAEVLGKFDMLTALHKHYTEDQLFGLFSRADSHNLPLHHIMYTVGMTPEDWQKLVNVDRRIKDLRTSQGLVPGYFPLWLCIDVANGYTERFAECVKQYRFSCPNTVIVAGNVVTKEMTEALILAGADIVKVGIGSGSVCTTRQKTGVGYPQLSAISECADAAHGMGAQIIADGGCREIGDIAKAFGAGADFVMLGGMLAGHDESGGEEFDLADDNADLTPVKEFYGMSSDTAQEKYNGGVAPHRASEGATINVPARGPVENTLREILGGLRSTCTYVGAKYLKQLPKCTTFVRVNR
jgi:GMP reductase